MKENDFLHWIAQQGGSAGGGAERVLVGIGDDMAVVRVGGMGLLKIDQCLDGVHVDLHKHSAAQVGRKAINRCLSDCAAMACLPTALMVSVALPRERVEADAGFAQELFLACRQAAAAFGCALVGGDTAIWDQRLAITVAALGEMPGGTLGREPVLRKGAKAGDTLFVSGALGGSLGVDGNGRHLTFEPRIHLARELAETLGTGPRAGLHAMMDLSDGLAQDLPRLCGASGVGAQILTGRLPIHADAEALAARDGMPAGLHALADGEDYELLFAVETDRVADLVDISQKTVPLTAIGVVTADKELVLVDENGGRHPWPRVGWEHA